MQTNKIFTIQPGTTLTFGVTKVVNGVQFSVYFHDALSCKLKLYKKGEKKPQVIIELTDEYKWGCVYLVTLDKHPENKDKRDVADILTEDYEYTYETDSGEYVDEYAALISGWENWGSRKDKKVRGCIELRDFNWEGDKFPRNDLSDVIMYQLHVRGFTKHSSSKVKHKGTYAGLTEKADYLSELGINAVMLLPCYEFDEVLCQKAYGEPSDFYEFSGVTKSDQALLNSKIESENKQANNQNTESSITESSNTDIAALADETAATKVPSNAELGRRLAPKNEKPEIKLNYWGYGARNTYYFSPKAGYASDKSCVAGEFKCMVKELHKRGIEVIMDIYFAPGTNLALMTDCLRHWVLTYHVDGFRVNDDVLPSIMIASDPLLSGVKLLVSHWNVEDMRKAHVVKDINAFAEYNEGFMNDMRRFLKSDEGMTGTFVSRFYRNPKEYSVINFATHVNGFTLNDLVSYDIKHNENNGENNTDGTDFNYSWNCGAEGFSRKKAIVRRRMKQIRNAFLMLLTAQGTPMILAGDEFLNTQYGNNNAYCHDNKITWLDWSKLKTYKEIHDYVKQLIAFRKQMKVLHQKSELMFMDSKGIGMPDISIHSTSAWKADYTNYNRMLGILLYGDYVEKNEDSVYIIYNMYWEPKYFDLPQLPDDKEWYTAIETYTGEFSEVPKPKKKKKRKTYTLENSRRTMVPPRSIVVFVGR